MGERDAQAISAVGAMLSLTVNTLIKGQAEPRRRPVGHAATILDERG
jgi:hypothetical protein